VLENNKKKIRRRKATKRKLRKTNYGLDWKDYGVIWLVIHSVEANDIGFLISVLIGCPCVWKLMISSSTDIGINLISHPLGGG
jgi:hypothetical protein